MVSEDDFAKVMAELRTMYEKYDAIKKERDDLNVKLGDEIAALKERIRDLESEARKDAETQRSLITALEQHEQFGGAVTLPSGGRPKTVKEIMGE